MKCTVLARGLVVLALALALVATAAVLESARLSLQQARQASLQEAVALEALGQRQALFEENLDRVLEGALQATALEGHRSPLLARRRVAGALHAFLRAHQKEAGTAFFLGAAPAPGPARLEQAVTVLVAHHGAGAVYVFTFTGGPGALALRARLREPGYAVEARLPAGYRLEAVGR